MKKSYLQKLWVLAVGLFLLAGVAVAQLPAGEQLLTDGLKSFTVFGTDSPDLLVKQVPVEGQSFSKAFRVDTYNRAIVKGTCGMSANITTNLHKDDVLWISFKARSLESKRETGESFVEVRFDQLVDGKYKWPTYIERGVSFGNEWTEISFPFVMQKDVEPRDVRLIFTFDSYAERFELSPVTFINCGSKVKMAD